MVQYWAFCIVRLIDASLFLPPGSGSVRMLTAIKTIPIVINRYFIFLRRKNYVKEYKNEPSLFYNFFYMSIQRDAKLQKCIDDCTRCYQVCVDTVTYCIKMGGSHVEANHLTLLKDCASICKTSMGFLLRESKHAKSICEVAAEICEACADSCEKIDPGDEQMRECARMCRECAVSCRAM